jgi:hypothetical protein
VSLNAHPPLAHPRTRPQSRRQYRIAPVGGRRKFIYQVTGERYMDTTKRHKTIWGGNWTERKLNAFEKYVNAYLTIMNKHWDKNWWKLIYFDAFAGSGSGYSEQEMVDSMPFLKLLGIEKADLAVYKRAAERVVCIKQRGFDY